ncbi:hypothetical protein P775_28555 [Puniceibacterium antarcticum]|uniref:Uncharacterized protein n=1 Tax=Puniceibacterium antarcticum TaxID=1206336 RepID=A0A2G8QT31_9RHOB|nr:hypothetical protein [Puniceibacterium antarcticum]PIL12455.1 hypothetical protein P775_28555 [Puniceibacterium antarcticum]
MAEQKVIKSEVVELDYKKFENLTFENCTLVFKGGRPPELTDVTISECEFVFEGSAMNTVQMMQLIAHGGDGALVVNGMLDLKGWKEGNV